MEKGDSLFRNVDLVLTDPPNNVQINAEKANSEHDLFTQEDIRDFIELFSEFMALGAHWHIFCSWMQFSGLY